MTPLFTLCSEWFCFLSTRSSVPIPVHSGVAARYGICVVAPLRVCVYSSSVYSSSVVIMVYRCLGVTVVTVLPAFGDRLGVLLFFFSCFVWSHNWHSQLLTERVAEPTGPVPRPGEVEGVRAELQRRQRPDHLHKVLFENTHHRER